MKESRAAADGRGRTAAKAHSLLDSHMPVKTSAAQTKGTATEVEISLGQSQGSERRVQKEFTCLLWDYVLCVLGNERKGNPA